MLAASAARKQWGSDTGIHSDSVACRAAWRCGTGPTGAAPPGPGSPRILKQGGFFGYSKFSILNLVKAWAEAE